MEHAGARFLADVFGPSTERPVFVCSLINNGDREGRGADERFVTTRTLEDIAGFARKWDLPKRGLYFCVSTLAPNARRRSKETVAELNGLHADVDFKDLDASPNEVRRALSEAMCPPSIVTATGHELHPLWLFKEAIEATPENIAEVERLLKRLVDLFGADPAAAECSRLLRLPGTHNSKGGEWVEVVTEVYRPELRYELSDLTEWLDLVPQPLLRRKPVGRGGNGQNSGNPFLAAGATSSRRSTSRRDLPPCDSRGRAMLVSIRPSSRSARACYRAGSPSTTWSKPCSRPRAPPPARTASAGTGIARSATFVACAQTGFGSTPSIAALRARVRFEGCRYIGMARWMRWRVERG